MQLFEITNDFLTLINKVNDAEITEDDFLIQINELNGDFIEKANNICSYIKNIEAETEAIKKHLEIMTCKRKTLENRVDSLKNYVLTNMQKIGLTDFNDKKQLYTVKIKKNPPSVSILDESLINKDFIKEKITYDIDKKAILQHFKTTGETVAGVEIVTKNRLEIK